jgi:hypothetical protein
MCARGHPSKVLGTIHELGWQGLLLQYENNGESMGEAGVVVINLRNYHDQEIKKIMSWQQQIVVR